MGKVYIDGTKIKGNASAKRSKDQEGFDKWVTSIKEEIKELLKEAEAIDEKEDENCKIGAEMEE